MTVLWIFLSIVAWFIIGIAFARHFRAALVELADTKEVGIGWFFILFWPAYVVLLLWEAVTIGMVDFLEFGDHLANVARTEADAVESLEKTIEALDRLVQAASSFGETAKAKDEPPQIIDGPFVLEGGKIRAARKAKEEVPHGEW